MTIPGFTSTGSKRPEAMYGHAGGGPVRFVRSKGCRVWDEGGREYLDLVMALGAVGLGYAHPEVVAATERSIRDGVVGPVPHVLEQAVAERIADVYPNCEYVRFLKTGAEAVAAAVRFARTYTNRDRVVTCGYHGWLDWCQHGMGIPRTASELRRVVPFNDIAALDRESQNFGTVAAVVIEPVIEEPPEKDWLVRARDLTAGSGAVLIFDEIKTAFRIANGGAAERYGVKPDIGVLGKALGNGFPIAAVCGSKDVMQAVNETWVSSTLATEHVSLAAALTVLDIYEREDVVGHLHSRGEMLMDGLNEVGKALGGKPVIAKGVPEMCFLDFEDEGLSTAFASAAAGQGVIFKRNAYNFVSLAHTTEDIRETMSRLEAAASQVRKKC